MGGRRLLRVAVVSLVLLGVTGCGPTAGSDAVRFVPVELPAGAMPEVMVAAGQDLVLGVRRNGKPGLLRLGPDGRVTEPAVVPAGGYGRSASWYSLAVDARQVVGIGGDRGGAHGNVRWSVWSGSDTQVHEQQQAFSTFGGWGAGGLVDSVLTSSGPAVVGSWQGAEAGLDVAVWTSDGDTWVRHDSTGTALASTRDAMGFPIDATAAGPGIVIVGWQVSRGSTGSAPVVWQSAAGAEGWTRTSLPDAGTSGTATAVGCADATCAVSGQVDGALALWRLADGTWIRVAGVPVIPVGDRDPLPAPLILDGALTQIVSDGARIAILGVDGATGTVYPAEGHPAEGHPAEGPIGSAVSAAAASGSVYLLARDETGTVHLWRADTAALSSSS